MRRRISISIFAFFACLLLLIPLTPIKSHDIPKSGISADWGQQRADGSIAAARIEDGLGPLGERVTSFLSTYVNKIDRKGRVSVPASFRASLAGQSFQGIIAYPSFTEPAIEALGRDTLEEMSRQRFSRSVADGQYENALIGATGDDLVETVMGLAHELPFDGEGRIILPAALVAGAGIDGQAAFVGRGQRFQIWAPDALADHQRRAVESLRARFRRGETP
jgi:transcriptional regulator MraZ